MNVCLLNAGFDTQFTSAEHLLDRYQNVPNLAEALAEHGLIDLFSRCYGREISLAHWRWKMQRSSADYENIWVATYEGRHVGQYAGIPVDAWVCGTRRLSDVPVSGSLDEDPCARVSEAERDRGDVSLIGHVCHIASGR